MYAARLRATNCMGCGGLMPEGGRVDRRYCRPGCRTLAYRIRLRTRGIEHGPTAVPRWAAGRLPELAQALTTLGRVQGNVTVLARQMECEEAAVRAWLLRLRALGETLPDVPVPEPEGRLRGEAERLRADLDEALAQRNKLDAELRTHKGQTSVEITKLRKEREDMQRLLDERAAQLTQTTEETSALKEEAAEARRRAEELAAQEDARKQAVETESAQYLKDQAELARLRIELATVRDELKATDDKLRAAEQERASLRDEKARVEREVAALRISSKKRAPAQRSSQTEGAAFRPDGILGERAGVRTAGSSPAKDAARERMEEQVANIRLTTSLDHLAKAREQGQGEQVQYWLSRNAANIHEAAQQLAWSILTERMGQSTAIPLAQAAREAYQQTLAHVRTPGTRHAPEFGRWFQESEGFLIKLTTSLLTALDARSSLIAQPESVMQRIRRVDPLISLMRDKVQLQHLLAEYQEERGQRVTGTLLEPMNEATVLAAARQAAHTARREFYFRSRGILSPVDPSWEVEGERLDARSEKELFGEVMDQIDRLKRAVDQVKPKGTP